MSPSNLTFITVIGVYMPSSDQSLETCTECLDTVEAFISEVNPNDPLIVVGDLNCHLGCLGGIRSDDEPNDRGVLWKSTIDCHTDTSTLAVKENPQPCTHSTSQAT